MLRGADRRGVEHRLRPAVEREPRRAPEGDEIIPDRLAVRVDQRGQRPPDPHRSDHANNRHDQQRIDADTLLGEPVLSLRGGGRRRHRPTLRRHAFPVVNHPGLRLDRPRRFSCGVPIPATGAGEGTRNGGDASQERGGGTDRRRADDGRLPGAGDARWRRRQRPARPRSTSGASCRAAIVDKMVERRFFRLLLPRSLGGAELLPAEYVPIIEAIAEIDASTAWCLNQNSGCSMTAAYFSPEVAQEIFGGPRGILAWGPGPGEARAVAGGYNVTAQWAFASGSHHASWLGCHVPVIEANGQPRLEPDGTPGGAHAGLPEERRPSSPTSGTRSACAAPAATSIRSRTCSCPRPIRCGRSPATRPTRRREPGLLYCFSSLSLYAAGFAGVAMGCARSTLASFIELARDKIPRGARVTMRNNNVIQREVGAGRGAAVVGLRLSDLHSLEEITEAVRGARPHHPRRADDDPPRRDLLHPHRASRSSTSSTRRPARPRSSTRTRSSGRGATSTRWRSSCRAARCISRLSASI